MNKNKGIKFDTFMHLWTLDENQKYDRSSLAGCFLKNDIPISEMYSYLMKTYKPKKCFLEKQRKFSPTKYLHPETLSTATYPSLNDVGNMISQINSVSKVCSLSKFSKYNKFILLRLDCEISVDKIPLIKDLEDDYCVYYAQDIFQIFSRPTLEIYAKQFSALRKIPYVGSGGGASQHIINAEILRGYNLFGVRQIHLGDDACLNIRSCGPSLMIEAINKDFNCLNDYGVYTRLNLSTRIYTCRFRSKKEPKSYQWIGINIPYNEKLGKISYNIKFTSGGGTTKLPLPSTIAGNKTHNPDIIDGSWLENLEINQKIRVERKDVSHHNNPFLLIFLDEFLNDEDLELEISDILIE